MRFHHSGMLRRAKHALSNRRPQLAGEPLEERRMMAVVTGDIFAAPPVTVTEVTMADADRQESGVAYFHPDRVLVKFYGALNIDAAGPHSALNTDNWRLMKDGVDVSHLIGSAQAVSAAEISVHFSERLTAGTYRIIARDLIHDSLDRPIDGDNDYTFGGDADATFFVASAVSETAGETFAWVPARSLPVVAADGAGNYVIAWAGSSPDATRFDFFESPGRIFAQRYNAAGAKVGSLIEVAGPLATSEDEEYSNLHIAMSADGSFVISWETQASGMMIRLFGASDPAMARRFDASGQATGEAFAITPAGGQVQSLVLTDAGEVVVGYRQYRSWVFMPPLGTIQPLTEVPVRTHTPIIMPPIPPGIRQPGDLPTLPLLLGPEEGLYIQRYSATGSPVGEAIRLGLGYDLRLVVGGQGIITAVWDAEGDTSNTGLTVQQFTSLGEARAAKVLINSLPGYATAAAIAMDAAGTITIAWNQHSDAGYQIYLQRFGADLQFLGQPIQVSQASGENLARVSIAMHRGGSFFVVWDTSGGIPYLDQTIDPGFNVTLWPGAIDAELGSMRGRAFDATGTARGTEFAFGSTEAAAGGMSAVVTEPGKLTAVWLDGGDYLSEISDPLSYVPVPYSLFVQYRYLFRQINAREFTVPIGLTVDLNGNPPGVDIKRNFVPGGSPALLGDPGELKIHAESQTLASARITIEGYLPGDKLLTYATNTKIHWSFNGGVLTLTGVDTVAAYEALLNDIWFSTTANRAAGSKINIRVVVNDGEQESAPAYSYISIHVPGRSSIAGRQLFYNNSAYDGSNPAANAADDGAIATDKTALLPGQTATIANYTSYTRGINGIMVDLAGSHGEITVDDFIFRLGNSNDPSGWAYAPTPSSIVVRPGAGAGGSDRVEISWADGAIVDTWLQVIVLDNGDTGLAAPDTFYFGNRVGDSGNESHRAQPQSSEALQLINRLRSAGANGVDASIADPLDFDRSGRINSQDMLAMFNAIRAQKDPLNMIRAPGGQAGMAGAIITGGLIATMTPWLSFPPISVTLSAGPRTATQSVLAGLNDRHEDSEPLMLTLPPLTIPSLLEDPDEA